MKRKLLSLLLALCMVLAMIPTAFAATVVASGECGDNATWTLTDDGTLTISGTGPIWDDYTLLKILGIVFEIDIDSIKTASVGNGITHIGSSFFADYSGLTEITIADSVTSIGDWAFEGCTSLKKITIPDNVTSIGERAFAGCSALEEITLSDGLTAIGWFCFNGCSALKEITIPNGVTLIDNNTFAGCTSLKEINLPDNLTSIEQCAFKDCSSLKTIDLPDNLTSVGYEAFSGCTSLTEITIPDGVTSVRDGAFQGCTALEEVTLTGLVYFIGDEAFRGCTALTAVSFNDFVEGIGSYTFADCTALEKIIFNNDFPEETSWGGGGIGENCFLNTTATAYYPCNNGTWTDEAVQTLATEHPSITWKADHIQQTLPAKAATCTATGLTEGKTACGCGEVPAVKQQTIAKTAHKETTITGKAATCTATGLTDGKKCSVCGTVTVKQQTIPAAHKYENNVCTVCGDKKVTVEGVDRVYGSSRYDTAFQSADTLKKQMSVEKFSCAIVTSGDNFADALAGSYLAYVKNAPILLTDNDNIGDVMAYIQKNVEKGATVYALGGKAVVTDKLLDLEKKGYDVKRLAGKSRFETNLEILKECGSVAGKDILVCTGFNFADSLSASAAKRPILLVDDKLTSEQKAYLKQQSGCKYCIVGGTGAVTSSVEKSLKSYGSVSRLAGSNRFETSVMVAKKFFSDPTTAVLAYGYNFPDGLCAGPLAATINAPLILTATGDEAQAAAYAKEEGIEDGYVLGGSALINDKAVKKIFSMGSGDKIQ